MRVTPSGESTPLSSSTASSTSSTTSITPQNTLNMLKELLAPNSRYHILYRKDDLIVKTATSSSSKKQKTDTNIQGCFFLFKDQSEAAKEQSVANVSNSSTSRSMSFNDSFVFTWVPYTVLASINEKLVTHIKDNGDLVTAIDYVTPETYNNTALNSSINSNENLKSVQVAASNYYVSAQISPNPNSNAGASESGSSLMKKSVVSFQAAYALTLPFSEIATLKRQIPALGWSYLIVMLRNGLSQPPIFFPDGGILDFFNKLQTYILMKKSNEDPNLFVVYGSAPPLHQSLNQIQYDDLFDDIYNTQSGGRDITWQLLEFGSKVSSKAKNFLFGSNSHSSASKPIKTTAPVPVAVKPRSKSPSCEIPAESTSNLSDSLSSSVQSDVFIPSITQNVNFNYMSSPSNSIIASAHKEAQAKKPSAEAPQAAGDSSGVEEDFEIISELDSKEVPIASVAKIKELIQTSEIDDDAWDREACEKPITAESWKTYLDPEGRISDPAKLKRDIFYGGIDDAIRGQVWKFLLGYYDFNSTYEERKQHDEEKRKEYEAYKLQWTSITPAQEKRHAGFRERKSRVEKDVVRTDRQHPMFKEDTSPYLTKLYDILVTYSFYNFDLAYCQGMGDLLSPILSVIPDEVEAFWTFASLMEKMETNFQVNSTGMETQLAALAQLVKSMDFELYSYLEEKDALNFFYCFRWVLVIFKREFSFDDIKRLWDSLWCEYLGNQFHLFICYAILHHHKRNIIDKKLCFDEIFKYCVDLSNKMNLNQVLQISEAAYHQYSQQTTKSKYQANQKSSSTNTKQ